MCLCVLGLDDRAEGMKEGWRERKKKEIKERDTAEGEKRKMSDRERKRDCFLGCRLLSASSVWLDNKG